MGLHTGTPLVSNEAYVGRDVHRAARIAAAAHGGQIVLSESTAALVPPDGLIDLGVHRFKDLAAPEHVWQAGDGEFPPPKSLHRTNLPVPQTPFLGRAEELAEVTDLVGADDARVLTLAGPGGTGKTRLALQAAAEAAHEFPDGVFWVGLAPVSEPALVLPAIAEAVGLREAEDLPASVAGKRTLLLLDNAEHLLPGVAEHVAALSAVEGPKMLLTSRERLGLQGERLYEVQSLGDDDALELFLARAAALDVSIERSATAVELCRRLDNLPLALELAAPRLRLFSPDQLLERLSHRLDLFEGPRDADPRQRTLRATIEWSYELLEPAEQQLFSRLAVFSGSANLEAVEAVCGGDPDYAAIPRRQEPRQANDRRRVAVLDARNHSGVRRGTARRSREEAARAHAEYYASLVQQLAEEEGTAAGHAALAREAANVRKGLGFARAAGDASLQLRLLTGAEEIFLSGSQRELAQALEEALAAPIEDPGLLARAQAALAFVEYRRGEYSAARKAAERAFVLAERAGDTRRVSSALTSLASVASAEGDLDEARRLLGRALELHREAGSAQGVATTVLNLGDLALVGGEYERSVELTTEAIELDEQLGGTLLRQVGLANLAAAYIGLERLEDAEAAAADSLAVDVGIRDPLAVVFCLRVFAATAVRRGDGERAALLLGAGEALDAAHDVASDPSQSAIRDDVLRNLEESLGEDEARRAVARGRALSPEDAVELALAKR
jgi:predicted ATPase